MNGRGLFDMNGSLQLIPATKLSQDNTIRDALKYIDDQYGMIIVIVDNDEKLSGIVSSGDIRKAILQGNSVDTKISVVMNKKPVLVNFHELHTDSDYNILLEEMRERYGAASMLYAMIPVINDERHVLGLISLESLMSCVTDNKVKLNYKTVLIVGGAGFIGSILTRRLLKNNWSVKVLDKFLYNEDSLDGLNNEKFTLIRGDAANIDDIVRSVEGVDAVIYLAELVGDPACSLAPQSALKTNYLAVTAMAHLCSHLNINRFVYASSCSVYGVNKSYQGLLTEESPLNPISLYARIKVMVEQSILSVCKMANPLFAPTILRLGTVFGYSYRPRFDLVVNTFVKNALQKGIINVFGGDQWRPNVHVSDVAEAIIRVLESPIDDVRAQIFNVGSNNLNYTINDLANMVVEVLPTVKISKKSDYKDKRDYQVDFSKIEKRLGFHTQMGLREGIIEIKKAFDQGIIPDFDDPKYYNEKKLQELKIE